jgi:transposase
MRSWPTLSREFDRLYAATGRPSIAPERLLRAQLLQIFYSIRSELLLIEQLDYNLLFRWFVGLGMDDEMDRFMKAFKEIFPQKSKTTAAG